MADGFMIVRDDGALFALGNGQIIAYGHGAEWEQVFGTPYSSPTALSLKRADETAYLPAKHIIAEGIWRHDAPEGMYEDTIAQDAACIARAWKLNHAERWKIGGRGFQLTRNAEQFPGCADAYLLTIPGGTPAYNWYPIHTYQYLEIVFIGSCATRQKGDWIEFTASGEGALFVASGRDYPSCIEAARTGLWKGFSELASESGAADQAFLDARRDNAVPADEDHPLFGAVQAAADDVALLIRAQQGKDGGVLAGSNYHLAYVRDQYGVSRGLLAMGCFEEAKQILRFYAQVFHASGRICNAQGIGVPDMFHVHENDEVEITGYLVHQACDMLEATGDRRLFLELQPMLEWALRVQATNLHHGMLPFNGDETYVAGGIVPRTVLLDGSMEATMLFIAGVERYQKHLGKKDTPKWLDGVAQAADEAKKRYAENFRRGDEWVCNSRGRREGLSFPEFRHGVCLNGKSENCGRFGWLRHLNDSWYVCPACYEKGELPAVPETEYRLRSALLMHAYMHSRLIGTTQLRENTAQILADYRATGAVSSLPEGGKSLGYDYGLILFAAKKYGLPADDLLKQMLAIRDSAGAWVEYYVENRPLGTRCRPWESAINIEAALESIRKAK